jgi:hypothetical protein
MDALETAVIQVEDGDVLEAPEGVEMGFEPFGIRVNDRPVDWISWGIEQGNVFHGTGRVIGTMLVVHLFCIFYPDHRVIPFELFIGNCDIERPDLVQTIESVRLLPSGYHAAIDYHYARGGGQNGLLVKDTWLQHGQGMAWRGRFISNAPSVPDYGPYLAPVMAACSDWGLGSQAWGPFGAVPSAHPGVKRHEAVGEDAVRFFEQIDTPGDLWRKWEYGLNNTPSGTGDQQDFGTTKLLPAFGHLPANPFHLYALGPSILREAGRPSYFFEPDGSPLRVEDHPHWWTWGLQTHYDERTSPDRLGKRFDPHVPNNTLDVKDFAHFSSLNLAGWTLATGSPLGRFLCRHEVTAAIRYGRYFGLGQERAHGRWLQALAWHYEVTGDKRIPEAASQMLGHEDWGWLDESIKSELDVKVFRQSTDRRYLKGKYPHWNPWHQGLMIHGLDAYLHGLAAPADAAGDERVYARLRALCRTHILWGWQKIEGRWQVGYAVRWLDGGKPLTPEAMQDPDQWTPAYGTDFNHWCWPAVKAAMRYWLDDSEVSPKAKEINAWLEYEWRDGPPPSPGYQDRTAEWRAM